MGAAIVRVELEQRRRAEERFIDRSYAGKYGQFEASGLTAVPTLTQGFTTSGSANPDQYMSLSGTLVHEMVHVVGRSFGTQCK